jgi:uncharacterized protein (DUF427 family)
LKAIWNEQVIAQSDDTVVVEGNHYFPGESLQREFIRPSDKTSWCFWKGTANYYTLEVKGEINPNAVWYYQDPKPKASEIRGRVAFWHGVKVID